MVDYSPLEARGHVGLAGLDPWLRGRHVRRLLGREGRGLDLSAPAAAVHFFLGGLNLKKVGLDRRFF